MPVNDPEALAAAANRLWQDATLRARLGRIARQRAVDEFHVDQMASRMVDVYRRALAGPAR